MKSKSVIRKTLKEANITVSNATKVMFKKGTYATQGEVELAYANWSPSIISAMVAKFNKQQGESK